MIIDLELELSDAQAITAAADSTNIINLGTTNMGKGAMLRFLIGITGAAVSNPTTSMTVSIQECATVGGTYTDVATATALTARLVAGFRFPVLSGLVTLQYVKVVYTPNGGNATTGAWNAALLLDEQSNND